jgi:hypothetical protein
VSDRLGTLIEIKIPARPLTLRPHYRPAYGGNLLGLYMVPFGGCNFMAAEQPM